MKDLEKYIGVGKLLVTFGVFIKIMKDMNYEVVDELDIKRIVDEHLSIWLDDHEFSVEIKEYHPANKTLCDYCGHDTGNIQMLDYGKKFCSSGCMNSSHSESQLESKKKCTNCEKDITAESSKYNFSGLYFCDKICCSVFYEKKYEARARSNKVANNITGLTYCPQCTKSIKGKGLQYMGKVFCTELCSRLYHPEMEESDGIDSKRS